MDRYWFLTWTAYGTWLPGDERGFVSNVLTPEGTYILHNAPGTPYDEDMPGLKVAAQQSLKGKPIYLILEQAQALLPQFHETAAYRGWLLLAVGVMTNHVHIVVGVPGDPNPSDLLRDFKSYGSRPLNKRWGKPPSGTWWTESGSKRKLAEEANVHAAVKYVRDQPNPLVIWLHDMYNDLE